MGQLRLIHEGHGQQRTMRAQAINFSTGVEHYTPSRYIEAAREAFGGEITLDPASHPLPQAWIRARTFYTRRDNGLALPWFGNVWMNPPYGKTGNESTAGIWMRKLIREYEEGKVDQAIALLNANTGDAWFQDLFRYPMLFVKERIQFIDAQGREQNDPTRSNVLVYLGKKVDRAVAAYDGLVNPMIPYYKTQYMPETTLFDAA